MLLGRPLFKQKLAGEAVTKTLRTMLEDPKVYKKQALALAASSRWPMNFFVDSSASR